MNILEIYDILSNCYNDFSDKLDALILNIDGNKYTMGEFISLGSAEIEAKDSFYVEIAPEMAVKLTGDSSFEYSFKVGVRKVEHQGVERWVHDGYFLLLDDEWWNFYDDESDPKIETAFQYGLENYEPSLETIYFQLFNRRNLWVVREFQMVQRNLMHFFETFEEAIPTLNMSFSEAMKVVFSVYETHKFTMDYYKKIKKQK